MIKAWRHAAFTRWRAMADRERRLVAVAAAVLVLALLWWVALAPALRTLRTAPPQIEALEAQLRDMRQLADEVRELRALPAIGLPQAQAALNASGQRLGSKANISLQGDRAVAELIEIDGQELGAWLAEVRLSARARVVEAQLKRGPKGSYSGRLVLAFGVKA